MQGGIEAAKPVINNRINQGYCVLVVHYLQTFIEIINLTGINLRDRQSPAGGLCYLHYPNQIHPSDNIDIIISPPEPEMALEIKR